MVMTYDLRDVNLSFDNNYKCILFNCNINVVKALSTIFNQIMKVFCKFKGEEIDL
jgi:hypothetical protein